LIFPRGLTLFKILSVRRSRFWGSCGRFGQETRPKGACGFWGEPGHRLGFWWCLSILRRVKKHHRSEQWLMSRVCFAKCQDLRKLRRIF